MSAGLPGASRQQLAGRGFLLKGDEDSNATEMTARGGMLMWSFCLEAHGKNRGGGG